MSKFLAIIIAAVLIFSLFLTVFAIGDGSDRANSDSSTTAASGAASASVTAAATEPSSGIEADIYLDPTGEYGYSTVEDSVFVFKKLDFDQADFDVKAVYFSVNACTFDNVTYEPNVRLSYDGVNWFLPSYMEEDGGNGSVMSDVYSSIYVAYCVLSESNFSMEEFFDIKSNILTNQAYFSVWLSEGIGDPTQVSPG